MEEPINIEHKQRNAWKTIAIILIIIFGLEIIIMVWAWKSVEKENKLTNICYYDVCESYVDAGYNDGVCFCYELDVLGNYVIGKTEILN